MGATSLQQQGGCPGATRGWRGAAGAAPGFAALLGLPSSSAEREEVFGYGSSVFAVSARSVALPPRSCCAQVTLAGLEPLGSTPSLRELVPLCWGNPGIALAISWASFSSCLCQRLAL